VTAVKIMKNISASDNLEKVDEESEESGSTLNSQKIMEDRQASSNISRKKMICIISFNILLSLAQIPIILECELHQG